MKNFKQKAMVIAFFVAIFLFSTSGCRVSQGFAENIKNKPEFHPIKNPNIAKPESTDPALPHTHQYSISQTTPAGCNNPGEATYTCEECGDSYTVTLTAPTGHTWSNWSTIVPSTCTEPGQQTRSCIHCVAEETEDIPAIDHAYAQIITPPSCENAGYTSYTCAHCNHSHTADYQEPTGHQYGPWETTREPSTTQAGEKTHRCELCGNTETASIPKKEAVNLNAIQPTDIFEGMNDDAKPVVAAILKAIEENYGKTFSPDEEIRVYGTHNLSYSEYTEMTSYLCLYFGTYSEPWHFISVSNGTRQEVTINIAAACKAEQNRRAMMTEIDQIIATFEAGTEDALIAQSCAYLTNRLSYSGTQPNATETFPTGTGNCNAYSMLLRLMLHKLGIRSDICIGHNASGVYHAWNRVTLSDGTHKFYDLTYYESTHSTAYLGASATYHNLQTINNYLYW